ncbi:MAG: DUF2911 domain-containing protein [Acidobacteria bacterium]|nr:DUF2911 domain-containing protein [Acidobacteriota bacterium]
MKLTKLLPILVILCLAVIACAQGGNDRGKAEATIKGKTLSIDYGRPELKGRDLLSLAPVGTVWRLGKNQATQIDTAAELDIAGTKLAPGKYSLWAKKVSDTQWHLCFHPKTGVWGSPVLKDGYVAELPLQQSTAKDSVELFTIALADDHGKANVKVQWGTLVLSGDLGVK